MSLNPSSQPSYVDSVPKIISGNLPDFVTHRISEDELRNLERGRDIPVIINIGTIFASIASSAGFTLLSTIYQHNISVFRIILFWSFLVTIAIAFFILGWTIRARKKLANAGKEIRRRLKS